MEIIWSRSAKETLATVLDYIEEYFDSTVAMKVYNKINNHVDSVSYTHLTLPTNSLV